MMRKSRKSAGSDNVAKAAPVKSQRKYFINLSGGTGGMVGETHMHMTDTLNMYKKGTCPAVHSVFESLDQGGKVMEQLVKLSDLDAVLESSFGIHKNLKLADLIKELVDVDGTISLRAMYPEYNSDLPFLEKSVVCIDLSSGFHQHMCLGAYLTPLMLKCAMESEEDQECGYRAIIDAVLNTTDGNDVRVVFIGSLFGGEGRTILSDMPPRLLDRCVEEYSVKNNVTKAQAEKQVKERLKIAEVQMGPCFRYPRTDELHNDVSDLTAGALRNFPKRTEDALSRIYYFDSDTCPVQAEEAQTGAQQTNHHHAVELIMSAAVKDFFEADLTANNQKIYMSRYSVPLQSGATKKTTWETLALPEEYRKALMTRLRFDEVLLHVIRPQIFTENGDVIGADRYATSTFVSKLYGVSGNLLKKKLNGGSINIDELNEFIKKTAALIRREEMFVNWFFDIAVTGKDWQLDTNNNRRETPSDMTDLVNVAELSALIHGRSVRISEHELDNMTNIENGNAAQTGTTLIDVYEGIKYRHGGQPREVLDIFRDIYDKCRY